MIFLAIAFDKTRKGDIVFSRVVNTDPGIKSFDFYSLDSRRLLQRDPLASSEIVQSIEAPHSII